MGDRKAPKNAEQNVESYEFEPQARNLTNHDQLTLAVGVASCCVKAFQEKKPPLSARELSNLLRVPLRFVNQVTHQLCQGRLLSEIYSEAGEDIRYQPSRPVVDLKVKDVIETLNLLGHQSEQISKSEALSSVAQSIEGMDHARASSDANKLLVELAPVLSQEESKL